MSESRDRISFNFVSLDRLYWAIPFDNDIAPVVMGGANIDLQVVIPGSFINVVDFLSIKELAHYLLYLSNNDTAHTNGRSASSVFSLSLIN